MTNEVTTKPTAAAPASTGAVKPTTAAAGSMAVAAKTATRPECQIITRLEARGADSLRDIILQLTGGDKLFVDKFVECCKQQVNKHWKRNEQGQWTNPFLLIPLNSQLEALYKCASRKVLPDGYNCNLIPYLGRDDKRVDVSIDYKGLIDTLEKEGIIADCDAKEVCEEDEIEWSLGEITRWTFDPRKPRGRIVGYCAWAVLPNGRKKWHYMSVEEIAKVRECARTQMIWNKWEGEMSKKTVIRRMFKTLPNTPRLQNLLSLDNEDYVEMEDDGSGRFVHNGTTTRRTAAVPKVVSHAPTQALPDPDAGQCAEAPKEKVVETQPVFA